MTMVADITILPIISKSGNCFVPALAGKIEGFMLDAYRT
jgi:hypothetical protein